MTFLYYTTQMKIYYQYSDAGKRLGIKYPEISLWFWAE